MAVVNGYCTVDELREQLGDAATALPLANLERAINATSRAIDLYCGHPLRRFWADAEVTSREYRPDDPYEADVADISSTSELVIATDTAGDGGYATTWSSSDYQLEPLSVDVGATAYAWTRIVAVGDHTFSTGRRRASLRVTALHGWSAVPEQVTEACVIRAAAIFKRKESVLGVAGIGGFGEIRITRRDPDVIDLLHNFTRITVGAV
ncbi:hypothetical protein ABGB07_03880 [Micromonosporaceae bacterium B7E4]